MGTAISPIQPVPLHQPVASVLASAWRAVNRRGKAWAWLVPVLSLVWLLPMELALPTGAAVKIVRGVATVLLSTLTLALWMMFVFNVLQQNHPLWARLVAGHVFALRRALYLGAAAITLGAAVLAACAGSSWPVVALIAAPACAAIACAMRWPLLWLLMVAVLVTLQWQIQLGLYGWLALAWRETPWALAAAVFAGTGLALRAAVFTGSSAHALAQSKLNAAAAVARGELPTAAQRQLSASWFGPTRWMDWAYGTWLRRELAQPTHALGGRLALGVGPQAHWTGPAANALNVLLLCAVVSSLHWLIPERLVAASCTGMLVAVAMVGLLVPLQLPSALWATRREQALLTLLPGTPTGAALNRWLAMRLAALDVAVVLVLMVAVALFGHFMPSDPRFDRFDEAVLGALIVGMLLTPTLWRDWSRARAPSGLLQLGLISASVMAGAIAGVWVYALERPWYELAPLTALAALPLGLWRWRRLRRLPAAWPVGRIVKHPSRSPFNAS